MISMSQALGVNCVYCHNSRSFAVWDASTPKRTTAWYGIRMARALNSDYLVPLTSTLPVHRLGVLGDVAKARAILVLKALVADRIAADRVVLDKPVETTGSVDPPDARRVEATVQP